MNRTLVNVIVELIKKGTPADVAAIRNLLGSPIIGNANPTIPNATANWKIYNLGNVINTLPLSPDEIMNQLSTLQMQAAPVLSATLGELTFNVTPGTVLATTIINVPHSISVRLEVDAPYSQIAIYVHETLSQRGSNDVVAFLNVPAGKTVINVVTQGAKNSTVTLNLPPDISTDFTSFLPPQPTWLNSGTINAGYLDPASGHVGVQLFWNNQTNVGGWDVYRVLNQDFGTIQQCSTIGGKYFIITNFSGTVLLPFPGSVGVNNNSYIGILETSSYSVDFNQSTFLFKSFDNGDSVFSGTLSTINFSNIGIVPKNSNDSIISFADTAVQVGTTYSYTIDSFSSLDPTLRSDKIQILTVTLPSIPAINSAILTEQTPGYLTLVLNGVDIQVRYWSGWLRKNNWPTVTSGSAVSQLNNDYLKFADIDANQTTFTFSAGAGYWYGIIVPYDANNNAGPRTLCSGQVFGVIGSGAASIVPAISQLGIDLVTNGVGVQQNKIWWQTNKAGERPDAANGAIQVQIIAFNSVETPQGPTNITTPNPRFLWQDWEDAQSNFGTSNTRLLYGSMQDPFASIQKASDLALLNRKPKYSIWQYTINILSGGSTLGTYNISIGGNYSSSANSGSGGGGFPPKK